MSHFGVNPTHSDPYKNFKFRIKWGGRYVAGFSKVSALKSTADVIKHRSGEDPNSTRKLLGRTKYEPITLERGITYDGEFDKWANMVPHSGTHLSANLSLKHFR